VSTFYNIQQTAVIGAGTMGRGIVISLARAGIDVLWLDNDPNATEAGLAMLAQTASTRPRRIAAWHVYSRQRPMPSWPRSTW
jgi:3-hydroxyacyl-CoA dehydrogenase